MNCINRKEQRILPKESETNIELQLIDKHRYPPTLLDFHGHSIREFDNIPQIFFKA